MNKLRVLCAYADRKTYEFVESACKRFHTLEWQITPAADGSEAIFKASNSSFDLIVLEQGLLKIASDRTLSGLRNSKELNDVTVLWIGAPEKTASFEEEIERKKLLVVPTLTEPRLFLDALVTALNLLTSRKTGEFTVRALKPGDFLMKAGDAADQVFILKSGKLKASIKQGDEEIILGFIEPGEFVGEMAYLSGEKRSADVVAEQFSELISIPIRQFEATLASRPTWGVAMMKVLAKRLKQSNLFGGKKTIAD